MLVEGINESGAVFRTQVFRSEGCIAAEEELIVQFSCTYAAETQTNTL